MPPYEGKHSFEHVIRLDDNDIDVSEFQIPKKEVDILRKRVLLHLEEDGVQEEYEDADIDWLLRFRDYNVERFAMSARVTSVDGFQLIQRCLLWRKQTNLSRLTDESFPREFYEKGGLFRYKEDAHGTPLLYMRIKMIKKFPKDIDHLLKLFLAHQVSKIDNSCHKLMGWAVVFDCSDIGFANVQIDMMRYLITMLKDYFPAGRKSHIHHFLPRNNRLLPLLCYPSAPDLLSFGATKDAITFRRVT